LEVSPCASICGARRRLAILYSQLRCASSQHECMIHLHLSSDLGSKTKRIRTRRLQPWRCKQVHLPMMHEKAVREHFEQRFSREGRLGAKRRVLAILCGSTNAGDNCPTSLRQYPPCALIVETVETSVVLLADGMRTSLEQRIVARWLSSTLND
jgi:hypothetical protein